MHQRDLFYAVVLNQPVRLALTLDGGAGEIQSSKTFISNILLNIYICRDGIVFYAKYPFISYIGQSSELEILDTPTYI